MKLWHYLVFLSVCYDNAALAQQAKPIPYPHNQNFSKTTCRLFSVFDPTNPDALKLAQQVDPFATLDEEIVQYIKVRRQTLADDKVQALAPDVKKALCDGTNLSVREECTDSSTWGGGTECRDTRTFDLWEWEDRELCSVWADIPSINPPPDGGSDAHVNVLFDDLTDPSNGSRRPNFVAFDIEARQTGLNNKRSWIHGWINVTAVPVISDEARAVVGCMPRGYRVIRLK